MFAGGLARVSIILHRFSPVLLRPFVDIRRRRGRATEKCVLREVPKRATPRNGCVRCGCTAANHSPGIYAKRAALQSTRTDEESLIWRNVRLSHSRGVRDKHTVTCARTTMLLRKCKIDSKLQRLSRVRGSVT
uniref:Putative secreted peptide n=1 Tax=Anopheles braziliensis TaxID=58242 RepID=A0A2M3ZSR0_9DIPT